MRQKPTLRIASRPKSRSPVHTRRVLLEHAHNSALDVWLQRASHIAQTALFLLTLGTLYFTVLPLYQKALLDEQIAQKELRLAQLAKSMESAYRTIRASAVKDFAGYAAAECSGLLEPPHFDELKGPRVVLKVLDISPTDCLTGAFDGSSELKQLNRRDYEQL